MCPLWEHRGCCSAFLSGRAAAAAAAGKDRLLSDGEIAASLKAAAVLQEGGGGSPKDKISAVCPYNGWRLIKNDLYATVTYVGFTS